MAKVEVKVAAELGRSWRTFRLVFGLVGALLLVGFGLVVFADGTAESIGADLIGSSMIGLAFAFVGQALDERNEQRARAQAARDRVVQQAIALRSRAQNAQLLIPAHRSAKTYGEQLRVLVDDGRRMVGEMEAVVKEPDLALARRADAVKALEEIHGYLEALAIEYQTNYEKASSEQGRSGTDAAWSVLSDTTVFAVLNDFLGCGPTYSSRFASPLDQLVSAVHALQ